MKQIQKSIYQALTGIVLFFGGSASAYAQGQEIYIAPYIGAFEILRDGTRLAGGVEGRIGKVMTYVVPKVGLLITTKNSRYVYAGFNLDFPAGDQFMITPGFAVGAYAKGDGKDLGGTLEFRSSIELARKIPGSEHRLGLSLSHISNASIYKRNPGVEDLMLVYSIPVM